MDSTRPLLAIFPVAKNRLMILLTFLSLTCNVYMQLVLVVASLYVNVMPTNVPLKVFGKGNRHAIDFSEARVGI